MSNSPAAATPQMLNYSETAQWKDILRQAITELRVSIPAIILEFDASNQTATVQIALREVVRTPTGPQNVAVYQIQTVPVMFPSAGGFSLTLPLAPGDEGFLLFCDCCIDLWWARGGVQNQLERRRHDLHDCGFYPGGRSAPRALSGYSGESARLTKDDGSAYIELTAAGGVNVVAPAGVVITGDVAIDGLITGVDGAGAINLTVPVVSSAEGTFDGIAVSTHTHSGVQTGSGDTGPPV